MNLLPVAFILLVAMDFIRLLIASIVAFFFTRAVTSAVSSGASERLRSVDELPRRRMVRCAACGIYVLETRALPAGGGAHFCSRACAGRGTS